MNEIKQVNTTLVDKPTHARKRIDFLKNLTKKQIEDLHLTNITQIIQIAKRMMSKKTLCRVMKNIANVLDVDIKTL